MMKKKFKLLASKKKKQDAMPQPSTMASEPDAIHPKLIVSNQEQFLDDDIYILKYKHKQLPKLQENQLQVQTFRAEMISENEIRLDTFIRQSSDNQMKLESASIVLRDENDHPITKKEFIFHDLQELPPRSSVPYAFVFDLTHVAKEKIQNTDQWSVAFEMKTPHRLVFDPTWETALTKEQRDFFQSVFDSSPVVSKDELNFLLINGQKTDEGIKISVMIRNGKEQNVQISQLPLALSDENGTVIAKGTFVMDNFTVLANTSKPWMFLFSNETIVSDQPLQKIKLNLLQ